MTIEHAQAVGNSGLNFNGVTYDLDTTPGSVELDGVVKLPQGEFAVLDSFVLTAGLTIFVNADGTLTTDGTTALAHLAWYDGTDLHVIRHG